MHACIHTHKQTIPEHFQHFIGAWTHLVHISKSLHFIGEIDRWLVFWLVYQSTSMAYGKVTEDSVYTCTGHPLRSDIANILDWALNRDFTTAYNCILL